MGEHRPAVTALSASVVVVTLDRPDHVVRCLEHLEVQTQPPRQIVVIDSSTTDDTGRRVRDRFPAVTYRATSAGRGATAAARSLGLAMTSGDVVAFLDDDAYAEPEWLARLLVPYREPEVGGVGGRQIRRQPGELTEGMEAIGRLLPDGTLTGNFAADPGRPVAVDHLLGANMSFRRRVLEQIGGIHDGYFGTCLREETDLCLRVAAAGYRLIYTPDAVVEHVAAPYPKGRRFDVRYTYWGQKNHLVMLVRNFGAAAPMVRAYLKATARTMASEGKDRVRTARTRFEGRDPVGAARSVGSGAAREMAVAAATLTGLGAGVRMARLDRRGIAPTRRRRRR